MVARYMILVTEPSIFTKIYRARKWHLKRTVNRSSACIASNPSKERLYENGFCELDLRNSNSELCITLRNVEADLCKWDEFSCVVDRLLFLWWGKHSKNLTKLQIVDGNAKTNLSNRKETGIFCGEIEQMQTFISETSFVKIIFQTDNYTVPFLYEMYEYDTFFYWQR
jgi:hypothetical protein